MILLSVPSASVPIIIALVIALVPSTSKYWVWSSSKIPDKLPWSVTPAPAPPPTIIILYAGILSVDDRACHSPFFFI